MADRARRYRAGEKGILPEIPQGTGADPLWILHDLPEAQHGPGPKIGSAYGDGAAAQMAGVTAATAKPSAVAAGGMKPPARTAAGAAAPSDGSNPSPGLRRKSYPTIDLAKCTYPRCDACIFGCPVDAIDMSLTVPGDMASSELIIKNACTNCGLCQKLCVYDAVSLGPAGGRTNHAYDMAKCTYPKCTICVDHCPMNSIDFATRPPMIHNNCEGCDLCYCICPRDAISIPNLLQTHARMRFSPDHPFVHEVDRYEAAGRFRRLVPLSEVGFGHPIYLNMNVPRIVLNEDDEATYCDKPCKLQG
jgi:formate hydrogenlyase subunit 6/NADH:ubiquinone oxidoreductase subunit I